MMMKNAKHSKNPKEICLTMVASLSEIFFEKRLRMQPIFEGKYFG
jgi:hypothetical protein